MDLNSQHIQLLLLRYLKDQLNEEELKELDIWAKNSTENQALLDQLSDEQKLKKDLTTFSYIPDRSSDITRFVLVNADIKHKTRTYSLKNLIKVGYAAALLLVAGFSYYMYLNFDPVADTNTEISAKDIFASNDQPFVILPSGKKITLKPSEEGVIVGTKGLQYSDGSSISDVVIANDLSEIKLRVPKGTTYKLTLSDGTTVWLNAASTLTYPHKFSGDKRVVSLDGEAFFDVAKADRPFVVHSREQQVQVLGTSFNINSYQENSFITTTLLTGEIILYHEKNNKSIRMKPGEQVMIADNRMHLDIVNSADAIAWRSGKFVFDNKSFKEVMNDLARWYDIKVIYEGEIPKESFFGDAYRNNNLGIVLEALQSSNIEYEMEANRTLIIRGKKGGHK
ncbi:FecR family protein [Sphingobacterium faecale]|uniref:FecR domain-containing protein n=1 Tax=Sphingobacterium faecale TaxID=2803775 RepID=A0ABS1R3X2_9SPHI|nr:FecR family protein [Sphingobacterium faecale]MBL1409185.1 FecR domain-containing protein [Sphingobacterium faecale]